MEAFFIDDERATLLSNSLAGFRKQTQLWINHRLVLEPHFEVTESCPDQYSLDMYG